MDFLECFDDTHATYVPQQGRATVCRHGSGVGPGRHGRWRLAGSRIGFSDDQS
ncbi:hypothetical protein CCP3SC1AL1_20016 [Gammaproteobacteria bacterium]